MPKQRKTSDSPRVPSERAKSFLAWRDARGISTKEVSRQSGVSYQTLASFVQGDTQQMLGGREQKIADAYQTTPAEIFGRNTDQSLDAVLRATAKVIPIRSPNSHSDADSPTHSTQPSSERLAEYEQHAAQSGWYLTAWRDYRRLTLQELAAAIGVSPAKLEDLETGARRENGRLAQPYTADLVQRLAQELGTTGGYLIDVNPFAVDLPTLEMGRRMQKLGREDRLTVITLAERLLSR